MKYILSFADWLQEVKGMKLNHAQIDFSNCMWLGDLARCKSINRVSMKKRQEIFLLQMEYWEYANK